MNGYIISLPIGLVAIVFSAIYAFECKKLRGFLKHTLAIIYATINVYFVYRDSYFGVVQMFMPGLGKNDDPIWADIVAMAAIVFFGMLLYGIGLAFMHLGYHIAMWRKYGAPKSQGFWEYMDRLSTFKEIRRLERERGAYTLFEGEQTTEEVSE